MRPVDPSSRLREREHEPMWHLWFRYLWPFLYFRDVSLGSELERRMAYRHNREMRVFLPGFILKWGVITALCFTMGGIFDRLAGLVVPAACCFMTASWSLIVSLVLLTTWGWLERFPELYEPRRVTRRVD